MLPGISQLLIDSALDPALLRRLTDSPDSVFPDFDLSDEEKDVLRHPDHRLLRYIGAVVGQKAATIPAGPAAPAPAYATMLPDMSLVLTVTPCAQYDGEQLQSISYAVWVNPVSPGVDPNRLPPPPGASLPGTPLTPLHAVIQLHAVQLQDAAGRPQVGLSASFRQSANMAAPPQLESVDSEAIQTAADAVRAATPSQRYEKLLDLLRVIQEPAQ